MNKKRQSLLLFLLAALSLPLAAERISSTEGRYTSEEIKNLPAFHALEVRGDADVSVVQRENTSVFVSGLSHITSLTKVFVKDGVLTVEIMRPAHAKGRQYAKVFITAPSLTEITATQKSDVYVLGSFTGETLSLTASDDAEIALNTATISLLSVQVSGKAEVDVEQLSAGKVQVELLDKAEAEFSGMAEKAWFENKGTGELDAENLTTQEIYATAFSSGKIKTNPTKKLHAAVHGSGKILYKQKPLTLDKEGHLQRILLED